MAWVCDEGWLCSFVEEWVGMSTPAESTVDADDSVESGSVEMHRTAAARG
jgi:hypothetical protein